MAQGPRERDPCGVRERPGPGRPASTLRRCDGEKREGSEGRGPSFSHVPASSDEFGERKVPLRRPSIGGDRPAWGPGGAAASGPGRVLSCVSLWAVLSSPFLCAWVRASVAVWGSQTQMRKRDGEPGSGVGGSIPQQEAPVF